MATNFQATASRNRFLTFDLENEHYGVEILQVREIIGYQAPTHIPRTPEYVLGVLNLRGVIIPIIDLRAKLDMELKAPSDHSAIIITNLNSSSIGFVVDQVNEVATISEDEIGDAPEFGSGIDTDFLKGVAKNEKWVIMLLDLEKIFNTSETKTLEAIASQN